MQYRRIGITLAAAAVAEIFNKLIPFLLLHIGMQRLGVGGFGASQYLLWMIDIAIFLVLFGYQQYGAIALGSTGHDRDKSNRAFTSVIIAKAINAAFIIFALGVAVGLGKLPNMSMTAWVIMLIALFFTSLDMYFGQVAKARLSTFSYASIVSKLVGLTGVWYFVQGPEDAEIFALWAVLSNACVSTLSAWVMLRDFSFVRVKSHEIWEHIAAAFKFAPTILLMVLIERFDLFFIERWFGLTATGQYAAAARVIQAALPLVYMVGNIFLAEMLQLKDRKALESHVRASFEILLATITPVVVACIVFAQPIIYLIYGLETPEISALLAILSTLLLAHVFYFVFGVQLLPLMGEIKTVNIGLAVAAGFAVGACLLSRSVATPQILALISLLSRSLVGIWCVIAAKKYLDRRLLPLAGKSSAPAVIAGVLAVRVEGLALQFVVFTIAVVSASGVIHRRRIIDLLSRARRQ